MNIDIMIFVEPFAFCKCVFGILSGESRHKMAYIAEEKIKDPAEKALVEEILKKCNMHNRKYFWKVKRTVDIILSLVALIVFAPIMLLIGLVIFCFDGHNPIFKQTRAGRFGKEFEMYKFRTMVSDAEARKGELMKLNKMDGPVFKVDNDPRITKVGKFLRMTSLDELPQIYNILAGQMSVIGPRPALYNQYDLIEARDKVHANDIRPGLTGLAQVNGRDELPIDVKARYDGEYAAHVTFWNDVKIFFRSITYVFQRRGVVEGGTGAMNQTKEEKSSK